MKTKPTKPAASSAMGASWDSTGESAEHTKLSKERSQSGRTKTQMDKIYIDSLRELRQAWFLISRISVHVLPSVEP
jgi:hypothetical protein